MNSYAIGAGVDLIFEFRDDDGVLTDPSTAAFKIMRPTSGALDHVLSDATRVDTGLYKLQIIATEAGMWYYRGESDTLRCASTDQAFKVLPTRTT